MFQRLWLSCGALLFGASSVMAVDVAGSYTADTPQGPLVIELRAEQDHLTGVVHYVNQEFPLVAGQFGDRVNGAWELQGRPIPFTASFDGQTLTLNTNGATYRLRRADGELRRDPNAGVAVPGNLAQQQPAAPALQQPALQQPAPQVEMRQGRIFRFAVPQGWNINETTNGVDLLAPDGATGISHCLLRGVGAMSPEQMGQMMRAMAPKMGITDLQVTSSQNVPAQGNGRAIAYETTYRVNGKQVRGLAIYTVYSNVGGYLADTIAIQAPPEQFAQVSQFLMQLAQSVTVTNFQQVCGNDQLIQFQPPAASGVSMNHPNEAGDIIMKGWEGRQKVMDQVALQRSDANRGQSRWVGPDGTQIVAPNSAARVFQTPGGNAVYSNGYLNNPGPNYNEATPYNYAAH